MVQAERFANFFALDKFQGHENLSFAGHRIVLTTRKSAQEKFMTESVADIDVLWITAGLGCEGEIVARANATPPGAHNLVPRILPGLL